ESAGGRGRGMDPRGSLTRRPPRAPGPEARARLWLGGVARRVTLAPQYEHPLLGSRLVTAHFPIPGEVRRGVGDDVSDSGELVATMGVGARPIQQVPIRCGT